MRYTIRHLLLLASGAAAALLAGSLLAAVPAFVSADDNSAIEEPTDVDEEEQLNELLQNALHDAMAAWRKFEDEPLTTLLSESFTGSGVARPSEFSDQPVAPGVRIRHYQVAGSEPGNAKSFVAALGKVRAEFTSLRVAEWKVKQASWSLYPKTRGRLSLRLTMVGAASDGSQRKLVAWFDAEAEPAGLDRVALSSATLTALSETRAEAAWFSDVTAWARMEARGKLFVEEGDHRFWHWCGAAAVDLDGDFDTDVVATSAERLFIFINDGEGQFEEISESLGLAAIRRGTGVVAFDMDNDGDKDVVIGRVGVEEPDGSIKGDQLLLLRNDGRDSDGRLQLVNATEGSGLDRAMIAQGLAVADIDGDGLLDLYVACYNEYFLAGRTLPNSWHKATNGTPNRMFRNLGNGKFEDVTAESGTGDDRWSYAPAFCDFDGDGDQDIYVANDFGENGFFINDGKGHFRDRAVELGVVDTGNGMGACWGDYDRDGDFDLYVHNMSSTAGSRILGRLFPGGGGGTEQRATIKLARGNTVFSNPGNGKPFEDVSGATAGVDANWAWGGGFVDMDNDGWEDVYIANGFITGKRAHDT